MHSNRSLDRLWLVAIVAIGAWRPWMWIMAEWSHCAAGICSVSGTPPEWDFAIFWEAGRLALARDFSSIFVFSNFHALIEARSHYDIGSSPFAYPPPALLIFAPLAYLPLGYAYAVWMLGGAAALVAALRVAGCNWVTCVMVLASPAFLYNCLLGQNGAFTSALLMTALTLAVRRPGLAGALGALLIVKPQIGLMLPAAWAGTQRWRAAALAAAAVLGLVALSMIVFGILPWQLYFGATLPTMSAVMNAPFPQDFQASAMTVFILARAVGASVALARIIQIASTVAAFFATYRVWQANLDQTKKLSLTIFLGLLAMPYGYVYDMIGYSAALALIAQRRGPSVAWSALWIWPSIARDATVSFAAPVTPLIVLAAMIWVLKLPDTEPETRANPREDDANRALL